MRIFFLLLLLPLLSIASPWQYKIIDHENIPTHGHYQLIKFTNTDQTVYVNAVLLKHQQYHAKIIDQLSGFGFFFKPSIFSTTQKNHAFLGINGGYFTPSNQPLGLLVINGDQVSKLSHSKLLTGMLTINNNGRIQIQPRKIPSKLVQFALQAGPFLINGQRYYQRDTHQDERRTVIAYNSNKDILIFSTTPVSLFDLTHLLKSNERLFSDSKITMALNLDGGSSTAMTLFLPKRKPVVIPELLPVKDVLLFY